MVIGLATLALAADPDRSSASRPADSDRSSASRPADSDRSSASRPADSDRSSASRPADSDRSSASGLRDPGGPPVATPRAEAGAQAGAAADAKASATEAWDWSAASTDPAVAIVTRSEPAPAEFHGVPTAGGATVTYLQGRLAQVSFLVPRARTDDLLTALGGEPGGVSVHFTTDREELWVVRREGGSLVVATSKQELARCRELLAACPLVGPHAPPAEVDDVQAVNDALSRHEELQALGEERARLEAAVTVSCRGAMFPGACRRARADLAAFDAAHPGL